MELGPTPSEIAEVFHRLRVLPANKTCFDCNAKNPTWASVTYGIFICIDCSAVHRSLGVHLTFVRSTQLDTNWTWIQLRQMQLGGNANALQFFNQHNCNTTDAQKKYNSRGAQLYRDKLNQLALKACKTSNELHLHPHVEEAKEEKEEDFFTEHEQFTSADVEPVTLVPEKPTVDVNAQLGEGPTVNLMQSGGMEEHKSTITARKGAAKKPGLGKKGGLGATRVKTNFAEIEKQATMAEQTKLRIQEETAKAAALSEKEKEDREVAMRLAYKDLSIQQQHKEEQLKKIDPKKAEQLERLGMGVNARTGISHSALSDMKTIEQENVQTTSNLSSLGKLRISDNDAFFDEYSFSSGFSMNRNAHSGFGSNKGLDTLLSENKNANSQWVIIDDVPSDVIKSSYGKPPVVERPTRSRDIPQESSSDLAQKKFGQAKAISSDQFFNDKAADYETQANLNRFQGSSSISSSEFFGNGRDDAAQNAFHAPDLEDVRESVRQGVTKVAGKLSSLANGVMSSLQEKYGY
ncbi:putative GTPase activating protein for Arf [Popillia japonica]|uniref:GTPase activating protein for Arf n=1 Tax=Popillia japonica TaxID=7064 RepID=A0AAW1JED5_POPJA